MSELLESLNELWTKIRWHGRSVRKRGKGRRREIIGLDSEAYAGKGVRVGWAITCDKGAGKPFLFCASTADGSWQRAWTASDVIRMLEELTNKNADVFVFNLTYETGAIFRAMRIPSREIDAVRESQGEEWVPVKDGVWEVKVYPGKAFRIRRRGSHKTLTLWDAHNFFPGSLERVAREFLGETKLAQDVSLYTKKYVEGNWDTIVEYCLHDAQLTAMLMDRLLAEIERVTGVRPQSHYSPATWAADVFRAMGWVDNVSAFWREGPGGEEVLRYALGAYSGGKFEMRTKGRVPEAYQYDISSAYPAVIADLINLRWATVVDSSLYHPEADYGFLYCLIEIDPNKAGDLPHPVGVWGGFGEKMRLYSERGKGVMYYPVGVWEAIITKDEYEYLTNAGADVQIMRGFWIYAGTRHRLYENRVKLLYDIKETAKDEWTRHVIKIILNGLYGKFVQMLHSRDGTVEPGMLWHPIYGAIITARVRCWVSEVQRKYGEHILAVHTDSVISDIPLPIESSKLGGWRFKGKGEYIGIRCGIYQIGEKVACQGFQPTIKEGGELKRATWKEILQRVPPDSAEIMLEQEEAISWKIGAVTANPQAINVFARSQKLLSLNQDIKRFAPSGITAGKLLHERVRTEPHVVLRYIPMESLGSDGFDKRDRQTYNEK